LTALSLPLSESKTRHHQDNTTGIPRNTHTLRTHAIMCTHAHNNRTKKCETYW